MGDPAVERPAPDAPDAPGPWGRRVILAVVAGAAAYLVLAVLADASKLADVLARLDVRFVLLAVAFVLASLAVRSVRWSLYRHRLGVRAPLRLGLLLGLPQGRTGLVVKATHLRDRGVRYGLAIPAVIAERTAEILAVAALLVVSLAAAPRVWWAFGALGATLALLYLVLLRHPPLVEPILQRLERWHVARHRAHDLRLALGELRPLLGGRLFAGALGLSLVGMTLEASALFALSTGLGLGLPFAACLFAYFAGAMAGQMSALPGGILAAEGGMIGALLALGATLPEATALTLATRACTLWFSLLVGILAAVAVPRAAPAA